MRQPGFRNDPERDIVNPMDLDRVEETTMEPARRITDELIQQEGFSEEQAYEIALEAGQSFVNPIEDELTSSLEEGDLNDEDLEGSEVQSNISASSIPMLEEMDETGSVQAVNPLAAQPVGSGNKSTFPSVDLLETSNGVDARRTSPRSSV